MDGIRDHCRLCLETIFFQERIILFDKYMQGHSFLLYGPTLSWQITYLFFPSSQTKKQLTEKNLRKRYCDRGQR